MKVSSKAAITETDGPASADVADACACADAGAGPEEGAPVDHVLAALRALADPTRFRLYLALRQGEACVCELANQLGLAENLVSHHLKALRLVGLVHDRRDASDARWVYYQLDAVTLATLFAALGALFDPQTLGTRVPTCGPAAASRLVVPTRRANQEPRARQ